MCGIGLLHIDVLHSFDESFILSVRQYFENPLDCVLTDSSVTIAVRTDSGTVQALSFQNFLGIRIASDEETQATMNIFGTAYPTNLQMEGTSSLQGKKFPMTALCERRREAMFFAQAVAQYALVEVSSTGYLFLLPVAMNIYCQNYKKLLKLIRHFWTSKLQQS